MLVGVKVLLLRLLQRPKQRQKDREVVPLTAQVKVLHLRVAVAVLEQVCKCTTVVLRPVLYAGVGAVSLHCCLAS